jgi:hypothetical protein
MQGHRLYHPLQLGSQVLQEQGQATAQLQP